MTDYNKLTNKEKHQLDEFVKPNFALVNEKGEIRETSRNKPTLVGMKHYFQRMYLERLQIKKLDKEGKIKEISNLKPMSSSEWLKT